MTPAGTFEHGASTLQLRSDHDQLRLTEVRKRLRITRDQRSRPGRDDKVVAAWNALLVDALVQAAMIFDRPDWLQIATEAAEYVWRLHWHDGRLAGRHAMASWEKHSASSRTTRHLPLLPSGWRRSTQPPLAAPRGAAARGDREAVRRSRGRLLRYCRRCRAVVCPTPGPTDNATPPA